MTNEQTARMFGDPQFRDDVLRDALEEAEAARLELDRIAREESARSRLERYRDGCKNRKIKHKAALPERS